MGKTKYLVNNFAVQLNNNNRFFLPVFVTLDNKEEFAFLKAKDNMGLKLCTKKDVERLIEGEQDRASKSNGEDRSRHLINATILARTKYQTYDAEWRTSMVNMNWLREQGEPLIKYLTVYQIREVLEDGTYRDDYYVCSPIIFNKIRDRFPVWEEKSNLHKRK